LRFKLISHRSLRSARTNELDRPAEYGYRRSYRNARRTTRTNTRTHEQAHVIYLLVYILAKNVRFVRHTLLKEVVKLLFVYIRVARGGNFHAGIIAQYPRISYK
jgi:hypothetical protein